MITKAQRQYLKGLSNKLKPLVLIGKGGLTDNIVRSADEVLEAHELLKVSILSSCTVPAEEIALDLAGRTHSEIISQLGRKIVFYRRNKEKGNITLPNG